MRLEIQHGMVTDADNPHLGGYIPGGDPATYYPGLWAWLKTELSIETALDVGCGDGQALNCFSLLGIQAVGVDGVAQDDERILRHDFNTGVWPPTGSFFASPDHPGFDLVWSCEFVEHVEERFMGNFLTAFGLGRYVLMTHGQPGQPGWHHVNNQTADYWKEQLALIGYVFDDDLTKQARVIARTNPDPNNHFVRSGLCFRRR